VSREAAVIGGGISGLATARRLLDRGFRVTLYEGGERLGGLALDHEAHGVRFERFYHCLLPGDAALLRHVRELGLEDELRWRRTAMGFRFEGRLFSLDTPLDVLRFPPLRLRERLRLARLALEARRRGLSPELDEITAAGWVRSLVGERAFRVLWRPLLEAKIGDRYAEIPALWLSSRLHREKDGRREQKGWLRCGYRGLVDAIAEDLRGRGAVIRRGTPARSLEPDASGVTLRLADGRAVRHAAVVLTTPLPIVRRLAEPFLPEAMTKQDLDSQGVITGVFLTRRPLSRFYWTPWVGCGTTSQGVIERSNLVPPAHTRGIHVSYLVNYAHRDGALFARSDEELAEVYRRDLERMHPEAAASVVDAFVFRAPFVEPIWQLGQRRRRPPASLVPRRLYLACTAQLYPRVNSWNSCCEVVDEVVPVIDAETRDRAA
jgi:protoporphyrinogen oxidase